MGRIRFAAWAVVVLAPAAAGAEPATPPLTREAIETATFVAAPAGKAQDTSRPKKPGRKAEAAKPSPDPLLIKVQVLLDRAGFSPGAIDGRDGDNLRGALRAYAAAQGLPARETLDQALFDRLAQGAQPVTAEITLGEAEVKGPFLASVPRRLEEQAEIGPLRYTNPREMLAERYHMQRDLLSAMNPGKPLDKAGTVLLVAGVTPMGQGKIEPRPQAPKVTRIEVDKGARRVRAFGEDGALVSDVPASIGSAEKPAPSGDTKVKGVAFDPWYTYNPRYRFAGVKARHRFSIEPGPNNPVGLVWIDLAIPSYGIHGTPEPEKIGKTESHGCIRLTNWDARSLAAHVERGAKVSFRD